MTVIVAATKIFKVTNCGYDSNTNSFELGKPVWLTMLVTSSLSCPTFLLNSTETTESLVDHGEKHIENYIFCRSVMNSAIYVANVARAFL